MTIDVLEAFRRALKKSLYVLAASALATSSQVANAQTSLPHDADKTCTVSVADFANWFAPNPVAVNGIVNPADSTIFQGNSNCAFYKWAEQMFLWLTSPAPSNYGQGSHVFNSPVFYDVSPVDANHERTLMPISPGTLRTFAASIPQRGPQGKPVVVDNTGKMFTVVRPEVGPSGKSLIRNKAGQPIEIERTQIAPDGKPIFLDKTGKAIDHQVARNGRPRLLDSSGKAIDFRLDKTVINGRQFFLDGPGNVIDIEQGQATGDVLMAQNGSLVYYALQVNDVYAYFLTGAKTLPASGGINPPPVQFPTTGAELSKIVAFAGKTFPDGNALTVELKSAWIEVTGAVSANDYVTISATIPSYTNTQVGSTQWNATGATKQAQLALVGMHVVGSTKDHPEMIWATFEHINNTPNETYAYNAGNVSKVVPKDTHGTWLFSANPGSETPSRMFLSGADIKAYTFPSGTTVGASDVLRKNPWGSPGTSASNNTDIISINKSVIGMLLGNDVRKNYIMTGTTWTFGGLRPPPGPGIPKGTTPMANTTMETFAQALNCFICHSGSNMLGAPDGTGLSHIYGQLKRLP